jgi:hypothetical protein
LGRRLVRAAARRQPGQKGAPRKKGAGCRRPGPC